MFQQAIGIAVNLRPLVSIVNFPELCGFQTYFYNHTHVCCTHNVFSIDDCQGFYAMITSDRLEASKSKCVLIFFGVSVKSLLVSLQLSFLAYYHIRPLVIYIMKEFTLSTCLVL